MTAPVRSETRTSSPVADVFDVLTSDGWVERKAARFRDGSQVVRREVLPGGGVVLAVSRELPDGAPGFLTGSCRRTAASCRPTSGRPTTAAAPARAPGASSSPARRPGSAARMRVEPDGPGSAHVVVGETKVSVPLVGGKAESFIADMVARLGRTEGELLRSVLAQPGSS